MNYVLERVPVDARLLDAGLPVSPRRATAEHGRPGSLQPGAWFFGALRHRTGTLKTMARHASGPGLARRDAHADQHAARASVPRSASSSALKRDDLTGFAESGNKARKLEFLLHDALEQGADTLITVGALQSNAAPAPPRSSPRASGSAACSGFAGPPPEAP